MRYAFTIIYNGLHHLTNGNFVDVMVNSFDKWVIVEGFSGNKGSTAWCNNLNIPKNSTDGTIEHIAQLMEKYPNILFHSKKGGWLSKDEQVNKAVSLLKSESNGWLWQIDVDEQWKETDFEEAESMMTKDVSVAGAFHFNHLLCKDMDGKQLVGKGDWGDNLHTRLWWWTGQTFISHEPPIMQYQKSIKALPQVYEHYSYYFESDVVFKSKYYKGYASLYRNWKRLQSKKFKYPISTKELFGNSTRINHSKSYIIPKNNGL